MFGRGNRVRASLAGIRSCLYFQVAMGGVSLVGFILQN